MPQTDNKPDFESRLREKLRGDMPALDARTRSRLNQARQAAVAELNKPGWSSLLRPGSWLTAGGAVAAAVTVALLLRQGGLSPDLPVYAPVEDIEIILSEGDFELYEELEFYAWVELQPEVG
ncbi:MAG: hypothetical protein HKN59_04015 [Gammaproteobacteria bacterium]|nr:hypothetical protein [Gammaproteobacteria bacterium]